MLLLPIGKVQVTKLAEVYLPEVLILSVLKEELPQILDRNDHIAELPKVISGSQQTQKYKVPQTDLRKILVSENHLETLLLVVHPEV